MNIECVFFLHIFSKTFLVLRRTERDIVINMKSSCEIAAILVRFWWKLEFSQQVFEKHSNIKFH